MNLAVLSALGIPHSETRDTIFVDLCVGQIQESERRISTSLGVVAWRESLEASASSESVFKSDVQRQVGAGVQGARTLSIISLLECMLKNPVGAGCGSLEAASGAVAGTVYPIAEEEVDFSHNTSDVDTWEVTDAAALVGWCLKVWELVSGDLPFANGVIVVSVAYGEHVDIAIRVIALVAHAKALECGAEDAGAQKESGEDGGGLEMHFGLILIC